MDSRWEILWHALQDTGKDIELAFNRARTQLGGLRIWIPVLVLPPTC